MVVMMVVILGCWCDSDGQSSDKYECLSCHSWNHHQDGSGSIDIDEMRQCLLDAGKNMSEVDLKNLMDDLDDDKNGSIDFEEFVLGMVQLDTSYTTWDLGSFPR